jgi:hypothetical protein
VRVVPLSNVHNVGWVLVDWKRSTVACTTKVFEQIVRRSLAALIDFDQSVEFSQSKLLELCEWVWSQLDSVRILGDRIFLVVVHHLQQMVAPLF